MFQKLKLVTTSSLLILGLITPLLVATPALAAKTYPKGTCFVKDLSSPKTQVKKCSTLGIPKTQKDTAGNAVNFSKYCYDVSSNTSSTSVTLVNCDNTSASGPAQEMCSVGGKTVPCAIASDPAINSGNCADVSRCDLITKYLNPFINFLAALVGLAVVISIVIGGIQYGSSAGDPSKVSAAKNRIRNAIIALLVFFFLYALLNFLIPGGLSPLLK